MNNELNLLVQKQKVLYLQIPAITRNVMKRNNPVQTPARPYAGAATSMNMEEISAIRTYSRKWKRTEGDIT